jgi:hypothetical protein
MHVSGVHAHVPDVHWKLALPAPLGQLQLFDPPQPLLTLPHAVPTPGDAGHELGAQQAAGVTEELQVSPTGHPHGIVPPQPLLKVPHWGPPVPGPFGTLLHV